MEIVEDVWRKITARNSPIIVSESKNSLFQDLEPLQEVQGSWYYSKDFPIDILSHYVWKKIKQGKK